MSFIIALVLISSSGILCPTYVFLDFLLFSLSCLPFILEGLFILNIMDHQYYWPNYSKINLDINDIITFSHLFPSMPRIICHFNIDFCSEFQKQIVEWISLQFVISWYEAPHIYSLKFPILDPIPFSPATISSRFNVYYVYFDKQKYLLFDTYKHFVLLIKNGPVQVLIYIFPSTQDWILKISS